MSPFNQINPPNSSYRQSILTIFMNVSVSHANREWFNVFPRYQQTLFFVFHRCHGANKFKALLNQYNLSQHVTIPTHTAGNTLDIIITRNDLLVTGLKSDQSVDSDHFALIFNLSFQSPGVVKRTITHRNWKSVDISVIRNDIAKALMDLLPKIQNLWWKVIILC